MIPRLLYRLYQYDNHRIRNFVLKAVKRLEGGEFYSSTLRKIFEDYHRITIGLYSHGGCFVPGQIDKQTSIGRYCSIAMSMRSMNRNHPMEYKSTHAFFFNPSLGQVQQDSIEHIPLTIGNDVWIGHNAIIMPHVQTIGDGAVIAAGAVVHNNVPPYAVAVGNPARPVRFRFPKDIIAELLASRWWEQPIEAIKPCIHEYQKLYTIQADMQNEGGNKP